MFKGCEIVDFDDVHYEHRVIKSPIEIVVLKTNWEMTTEMFKNVVPKIKVGMTSLDKNEVVAEEIFTLRVIDSALPEPDYFYTNWFHIDCVADMYGVKLYTPTFYRVFDEYIRNMTAHRQNTLLLPAFTPALDTEVGEERMNVQLVDIERTEDSWSFGFQRMRRFVRHAKKCGIKYFEHCHLFSQWGAKAAPNIYDNTGKRIFGYDTAATGKEYSEFIRAYLRAFLDFAAEEGIKDSLIFHISDEPTANQKADYRAAREVISEVLSGYPISDAMFDCSFYDEGIVEQPILSMYYYNDIEEASCPSAWLYYTGGELDTSNRKITNTAAATRVLGLHMYKYKSLGFLHWAYNFYYDRSSIGFADPKINPCAYRLFPGVVYLEYPINEKGRRTVVPSIREKLMAEAMDDLRALRLLEARIGREAVISLCEEKLGRINVRIIPTGESLREFREIINAKLAE